MRVHLKVENFAVLRALDFEIPPGVSVVVGPNGSGKSTLLAVLEILREIFRSGVVEGFVERTGSAQIRNHDAPANAPIALELGVDGIVWRVGLRASGASVEPSVERVTGLDGALILQRKGHSTWAEYRGNQIRAGDYAAARVVWDNYPEDREVQAIGDLVRGYRLYRSYAYQLADLAGFGSAATSDLQLDASGRNAFAVLRNWSSQRSHRPRYDFVRDGLRHVFPGYFEDLDFQIAGQTVTVQIYTSRRKDVPLQVARESTGFLNALLALCAVASGEPGSMVAIDEPETSLHPAAIARLFERIDDQACEEDLRVLLATHSPVVLDQLRDEPSSVFVMEPGHPSLPVALDKLFASEWLQQFSLGRLYTSLEFGSPRLPKGG